MPRSKSLVNQHIPSKKAEEYRAAIGFMHQQWPRAAYLCNTVPDVSELFIDMTLQFLTGCEEDDTETRGELAWYSVLRETQGKNVALQYNLDEVPQSKIQLLRLVEMYELCVGVSRLEAEIA